MSKPVKEMMIAALKQDYEGVDSACVVEVTGMDVPTTESLRSKLRAKSARLRVVRNSLARRAFAGGPLGRLGEVLEGPNALVTTNDSIIDVAKMLVAAAKEFKQLKLKHAVFEGDPSLFTVEQLSSMRSRIEILGEVAMLIASPGRKVAGCIASPQSKIAGCLKAIAERGAD